MVENKTYKAKIAKAALLIFLGIIALSCLFPLWYTFCLSISKKQAVDAGLVTFRPIGFSVYNYDKIVGDSVFLHSMWVSIKRVVIGTPLSLLIIVLFAYPLSKSKKEFRLRNIFMWMVLFFMLFSPGLIPWYIFMKKYGMINNFWGLVLAGGIPSYYTILVMNFFRNFSKDIEEAAIIDGADQWTLLFKIVVPCSIPIIATIALFIGVEYWNEYYIGMLLSTGNAHYPLMTYIQSLSVQLNTSANMTPDQLKKIASMSTDGLNAAKVFVALIPMLVVYPFVSKYFVSGIMIGSVKE